MRRRGIGVSISLAMLLSCCVISARLGPSLSVFAQQYPHNHTELPGFPADTLKDGSKSYPELVDITASTGIDFEHLSSPWQKYIVESMSGGVALIDFDGDGWPDIYFTNAPSVEMAIQGKKTRSAHYHNNHDGTFTDVTDKTGVGYPCCAMGAAVGDYINEGWPDLRVLPGPVRPSTG